MLQILMGTMIGNQNVKSLCWLTFSHPYNGSNALHPKAVTIQDHHIFYVTAYNCQMHSPHNTANPQNDEC